MTVKNEHCLDLLVHPDVIGVGVGFKSVKNSIIGRPCIKIYVAKKLPLSDIDSSQILPSKIDGVPTDIVEFGMPSNEPRLQSASGLGERLRPVPIGASIGHFALNGAGTVSGYAKDKETGDILLMSCWHVLTNFGQGRKGDEIIQPALIDGGTKEGDTVAYLEKWVEVKMLGPVVGEAKSNLKYILDRGKIPPLNHVDVASAKPISEDIIPSKLQQAHVGRAEVGNRAVSIGRTSGFISHKIIDTTATMWVEYPRYGVALFDDVGVSQGKSLPGDSGAPFYVRDKRRGRK